MLDSNPHGKSRVYEQGTLWHTQFIHGDQTTSGISHQENRKKKKKNSIQNDVGVDRYFYSSESFTDHEVRTCIIVCTLVFLQRCSGLHSLVMNMTHSDAKCVFLSMNKKAIYCN